MQYASIRNVLFLLVSTCSATPTTPTQPSLSPSIDAHSNDRNISIPLFISLEEFSRIVDISYCVGTTGIQHPFSCASRCDEFPAFELVREFNTGPLMSDSCGYIAVDHGKNGEGRIIVAFRGTYSIANTIVDLSTVPQEYVPYPGNGGNDTTNAPGKGEGFRWGWRSWIHGYLDHSKDETAQAERIRHKKEEIRCENCTVHSGFWQSWQNTRSIVLPALEAARAQYPDYSLHLVGHSLGGAVAALAGLELDALGWSPVITTFGEPKVGNEGLRRFIDKRFDLLYGNATTSTRDSDDLGGRYRRVTHVDDPVPLLPLQEWGYRPHAGEIYISKSSLQPSLLDLSSCSGDEDPDCIFGLESDSSWWNRAVADMLQHATSAIGQNADVVEEEAEVELRKRWGIPIGSRYKMWQLFFAHRDYFWRLGLCVRGGDPSDWGRDKYHFPGNEEMPQ